MEGFLKGSHNWMPSKSSLIIVVASVSGSDENTSTYKGLVGFVGLLVGRIERRLVVRLPCRTLAW